MVIWLIELSGVHDPIRSVFIRVINKIGRPVQARKWLWPSNGPEPQLPQMILKYSPFHGLLFSFALQCSSTRMPGNFRLKLQNSPKLPHIHARLYWHVNEQNWPWKGLLHCKWPQDRKWCPDCTVNDPTSPKRMEMSVGPSLNDIQWVRPDVHYALKFGEKWEFPGELTTFSVTRTKEFCVLS